MEQHGEKVEQCGRVNQCGEQWISVGQCGGSEQQWNSVMEQGKQCKIV